MSCHSIGHGMSKVSATVLDLYEAGEISKASTMRLILACRKGVHWCDGNEGEAIEEVIDRGYCGLCFEKSDDLSSAYDNDLGWPDKYQVFRPYDKTAAHYWICSECKRRIIDEFRHMSSHSAS